MSERSGKLQRPAKRRMSKLLVDLVVLGVVIYVLQWVIFLPSVALRWRLTLIGVPVILAYLGALLLLRLMERDRVPPAAERR